MTLVFTAVPQPPRWPLWLLVVIVGLAGVLLAAALSIRRRRGVAAASVMQFRAHHDPGTQRIYVDGRPIETGVTQLTVPEERAATLHEPASAAEPPRTRLGRTDVPIMPDDAATLSGFFEGAPITLEGREAVDNGGDRVPASAHRPPRTTRRLAGRVCRSREGRQLAPRGRDPAVIESAWSTPTRFRESPMP